MDLDSAIARHSQWKLKFREAIARQESLDAEIIAKDNYCELGKWLHGETNSKLGSLPVYAECVKRHVAFHLEAGKVAAAINAGKYAEAEAMISNNSAYNLASLAVGLAIMNLKRAAGL